MTLKEHAPSPFGQPQWNYPSPVSPHRSLAPSGAHLLPHWVYPQPHPILNHRCIHTCQGCCHTPLVPCDNRPTTVQFGQHPSFIPFTPFQSPGQVVPWPINVPPWEPLPRTAPADTNRPPETSESSNDSSTPPSNPVVIRTAAGGHPPTPYHRGQGTLNLRHTVDFPLRKRQHRRADLSNERQDSRRATVETESEDEDSDEDTPVPVVRAASTPPRSASRRSHSRPQGLGDDERRPNEAERPVTVAIQQPLASQHQFLHPGTPTPPSSRSSAINPHERPTPPRGILKSSHGRLTPSHERPTGTPSHERANASHDRPSTSTMTGTQTAGRSEVPARRTETHPPPPPVQRTDAPVRRAETPVQRADISSRPMPIQRRSASHDPPRAPAPSPEQTQSQYLSPRARSALPTGELSERLSGILGRSPSASPEIQGNPRVLAGTSGSPQPQSQPLPQAQPQSYSYTSSPRDVFSPKVSLSTTRTQSRHVGNRSPLREEVRVPQTEGNASQTNDISNTPNPGGCPCPPMSVGKVSSAIPLQMEVCSEDDTSASYTLPLPLNSGISPGILKCDIQGKAKLRIFVHSG
ncbi:hypothetical protein NMY22_g14959 [Coprinellus aureogranulatus]|nr:hypothetical protein NMY22_g14959 [Coprinellus aureogranulatus]